MKKSIERMFLVLVIGAMVLFTNDGFAQGPKGGQGKGKVKKEAVVKSDKSAEKANKAEQKAEEKALEAEKKAAESQEKTVETQEKAAEKAKEAQEKAVETQEKAAEKAAKAQEKAEEGKLKAGENVDQGKGNAYGKNKGDLSGREFGQDRAAQALLNKGENTTGEEGALVKEDKAAKKAAKKASKKAKKEKRAKKVKEAGMTGNPE